jgi:hypothetical protein
MCIYAEGFEPATLKPLSKRRKRNLDEDEDHLHLCSTIILDMRQESVRKGNEMLKASAGLANEFRHLMSDEFFRPLCSIVIDGLSFSFDA